MQYTIKKGNQSSGFRLNPWPLFFKRTSLSCRFRFHENCLISHPDAKKGWGKFSGFSQGLHQRNSYRFGWMPDSDKIWVTAYLHQQGHIQAASHDSIESGYVSPDQWYNGRIIRYRHKVTVSIWDENAVVICQEIPLIGNPVTFGYLTGFYYGGGSTGAAPHDVSMDIILS